MFVLPLLTISSKFMYQIDNTLSIGNAKAIDGKDSFISETRDKSNSNNGTLPPLNGSKKLLDSSTPMDTTQWIFRTGLPGTRRPAIEYEPWYEER